ncbi:hypothetical protein RRG08_003058 [Elysia crispata]|uniref:Uncharacterized protein n=1 Tax=Elysia crispata TaxID=231223 RepID=A0AAE1B871_9GAST|nr:hypothetical protein RRG08_003058 [Elysia crispata]
MKGYSCCANTLACISPSSKTSKPSSSELDDQTRSTTTSHEKNVFHNGDMWYMTQVENCRVGFNFQVCEELPKEDHSTQACVCCENEDDFNITNMEIAVQKVHANKYRQALYDTENDLRIYHHDAYGRYKEDDYTTTSTTLGSNSDKRNFDNFKGTVQNGGFDFVLKHFEAGHCYKRQDDKTEQGNKLKYEPWTHCLYDTLKYSDKTHVSDLDYIVLNFQHFSMDLVVMPSWQIGNGRDTHNETRQDQTDCFSTEAADEGQYSASNLILQPPLFEESSDLAECSTSLNDSTPQEKRGQIFQKIVNGQHGCDGKSSVSKQQIFFSDDAPMNYSPLIACGIEQTGNKKSLDRIQQTDDRKSPDDRIEQNGDRKSPDDRIEQNGDRKSPDDRIEQNGDRKSPDDGIQQTGDRKSPDDGIQQTGDRKSPDDRIEQTGDRKSPEDGVQQTGDRKSPDDGIQQTGDRKSPDDGIQQTGDRKSPEDGIQQTGDRKSPDDRIEQNGDKKSPDDRIQQTGDKKSPDDGIQQTSDKKSPDDEIQQTDDRKTPSNVNQQMDERWVPVEGNQNLEDRHLPAVDIQQTVNRYTSIDHIQKTYGNFLSSEEEQAGDPDIAADGVSQNNDTCTVLPSYGTCCDEYSLLSNDGDKQTYNTHIPSDDMQQRQYSLLPADGICQDGYSLLRNNDNKQTYDSHILAYDMQQKADSLLPADGIQQITASLLPAASTLETEDSLFAADFIKQTDDKQITGFIQRLHSNIFQQLNYSDDPQIDGGSIKLSYCSGDQHTHVKHLLPEDIQQSHSPVYEKADSRLLPSEDIQQPDSANDQHIDYRLLLSDGFQQPFSLDDKEPDCRHLYVLKSQKEVHLGKDQKLDVDNGSHLVFIKNQLVEFNPSSCIDKQRFISNNQQDYIGLQQPFSTEDLASYAMTEDLAADWPCGTYGHVQPVSFTGEHERHANTSDHQHHISKQLPLFHNQQPIFTDETLASKRNISQTACEIEERLTHTGYPTWMRPNALTSKSESSHMTANEDVTDNKNFGQKPLSTSDRESNYSLNVDSQRSPPTLSSTLCLSHIGISNSSYDYEHRQSEKILIHVSDTSESEDEIEKSKPQGLACKWRTLCYMQEVVPDSDPEENIPVPHISDYLNHSNTAVKPTVTQDCTVTVPQTNKRDQMGSVKAGKVQESIEIDQKKKIDNFQLANVSSYLSQSNSSTTNAHQTFAFYNQSMLSSRTKQNQLVLQRLESQHEDGRDLHKQSSDFSTWETNDGYDGHSDESQERLNVSIGHEYCRPTSKQISVSSNRVSIGEVGKVSMDCVKQTVSHNLPSVESFLFHGSERTFDSSWPHLNNQAHTKRSFRPCCLSPPVFSSSEDEDLQEELDTSVSDILSQSPLVDMDEDNKKSNFLRHPTVYSTPFDNLYHVSSERNIFSIYGACQNGSRVAEDQDHISGKESENVLNEICTEAKNTQPTKSCLGENKVFLPDSLVNEKESNFSKHLNVLKSIADNEDIETLRLKQEERCSSELPNEHLDCTELDSNLNTKKEKSLNNSSCLQKILSNANKDKQCKKINNLSKAHSHKNWLVLKHAMPPCHVNLLDIRPFIEKSGVCLSKLNAGYLKKLGLYNKNKKLSSLYKNLGVPQNMAPTKHTPELLSVMARLKQIRNQNRQQRIVEVQENLMKILQAQKKIPASVEDSVVHHKCAGKGPFKDITGPGLRKEASVKSPKPPAMNKSISPNGSVKNLSQISEFDSHIETGNCFSSEFLSNCIENSDKNQRKMEGSRINTPGKSQQRECKTKCEEAETSTTSLKFSPKSSVKKVKKNLSKTLKPFENSTIKDLMSTCPQTSDRTSLESKFLAIMAQCKTEPRKETKANPRTDSLDKSRANFDQQGKHVKNKKQKSSCKIEKAHHSKPEKKNLPKTEEECGNSKILDKRSNSSRATKGEKIETFDHQPKVKSRKECGNEKIQTIIDKKSKTHSQDKVIAQEAEAVKLCPASSLSSVNIKGKSMLKKINKQSFSQSIKKKLKKTTKSLSGSELCDNPLKSNPIKACSLHSVFSVSSFKIPKKSSSSSDTHSSTTDNLNPNKSSICMVSKPKHDKMSEQVEKRDGSLSKYETCFQKSSKSSQDHSRMSSGSSTRKIERFALMDMPKCLSLYFTNGATEGEVNSSSVFARCKRGYVISESERYIDDHRAAAQEVLEDKRPKVLASDCLSIYWRDNKNLTSDKTRVTSSSYLKEDILRKVSVPCDDPPAADGDIATLRSEREGCTQGKCFTWRARYGIEGQDCHTSQAAGGSRNETRHEFKC